MHLHTVKNYFWKNINLNVKRVRTVIKKINSYRYLGIIIDRNLNQSDNIETIKQNYKKLWVYYIKQHIF